MDQQEIDHIQLLVDALQQTYLAKNNSEIKATQKFLEGCQKTDKNFLKHMLQIATQAVNIEIEERTKTQSCIQAVQFVRTYLNDQNKNPDFIMDYAQLVFQALNANDISLKNKASIQQAFLFFLQFDQKGGAISQHCLNRVLEVIGIEDNCLEEYQFSLVSLGCIIQETRDPAILSSLFDTIAQPLDNQLTIYLKLMNDNILVFQDMNIQNQLGDVTEIEQNIIQIIRGIKEWLNCFHQIEKRFLEKTTPNYRALMFKLVEYQPIAQKLLQVLGMQINTKNQLQNCMISLSGIDFFDQSINEVKGKALKIYNRIMQFVINQKKRIDLQSCNYYTQLKEVLPITIQTSINFINFHQKSQIDEICSSKEIRVILPQIMNLICIPMTEREFYDIYDNSYKQLIFDVIFPMLKCTKSDIELMEDEPQEFKNLSLDLVEKQKSMITKTQAAKLLEALNDNLDGAATFSIYMACGIIEQNMLQHQNSIQSQQKNPKLQDVLKYSSSNFIQNSTQEEQVETSLLALSILAYVIVKRKDLPIYIENLLQDYASYLFSPQISCIIKVRFIQLLGGIHEIIFKRQDQQQSYNELIQYLVNNSGKPEKSKEKIISLMSIQSLLDIFENPNLIEKNFYTLHDNFKTLQRYIVSSNNTDFFDLISMVILNFKKHLQKKGAQLVYSLIDALQQRILSLVKKIMDKNQKKKKSKQIIMNRCFSIIMLALEQDEYLKIFPGIEVLLKDIFQLMQYPQETFLYDILQILIRLIRKQKTVSQNLVPLLKYFTMYLDAKQYVMHDMVIVLNLFVYYGHQYLQNSHDSLLTLLQLCFGVVNAQSQISTDADKAEGAIIIHTIIENLGEYFNDSVWLYLVQTTYQSIQNFKQDKTADFLYGRTIGILLACFIVNFDKTIQVTQGLNSMELLMHCLTSRKEYFRHVYDTKVFILGMTSLVLRTNLPEIFQLKYPEIFYTITVLLKNLSLDNQILNEKKKEHEDRNLDTSDDNSDIEDEDDEKEHIFPPPYDVDDEEIHPDIMQDDDTLSRMKSKILVMDEFSFFKQKLVQLKQQNIQLYEGLLNRLDQKNRDYVQKLMNIQRIQIDSETQQTTTRKIVKVKRRNPQETQQVQDFQQQQQQQQFQQQLQQQQFVSNNINIQNMNQQQ